MVSPGNDIDSDLDWDALRYFLRAAQAKSLSGAARTLGVEHTTVGRRLSGLESAIGAALVERKPSGLELTRLGRRALRLASEMDRLARAIGELGVAQRESVRLVVPSGFTALLTPHLEALGRIRSGVSLEVVSSARRVDLRKGEADLAIRVGPIDDEALIARKLADVGSALYASRGYLARHKRAIDTNDLSGHSVIGFQRSLAAMPAAEWLSARSEHASIVLRSREAVDMVAAARSGAGLAVLPCFLADAEPALVRLTAVPIAPRRVSLVYRREARLSPAIRAVIRLVIDVMRGHATALRGDA